LLALEPSELLPDVDYLRHEEQQQVKEANGRNDCQSNFCEECVVLKRGQRVAKHAHPRRSTTMRGRKNPPLDLTPIPDGTPLTFDVMAQAYLEDYQLQCYRTMVTARARVEHLRGFFGGWAVEAMTADRVRDYQMHRRRQGAEAATINRETSALSRMFQLSIRRGLLERMPLFPNRLEENPPREGFFEHDEYLKVRAQLPASYQDVLDFAY
jgi:hypothetical protein